MERGWNGFPEGVPDLSAFTRRAHFVETQLAASPVCALADGFGYSNRESALETGGPGGCPRQREPPTTEAGRGRSQAGSLNPDGWGPGPLPLPSAPATDRVTQPELSQQRLAGSTGSRPHDVPPSRCVWKRRTQRLHKYWSDAWSPVVQEDCHLIVNTSTGLTNTRDLGE
jgi:hypothetical protein